MGRRQALASPDGGCGSYSIINWLASAASRSTRSTSRSAMSIPGPLRRSGGCSTTRAAHPRNSPECLTRPVGGGGQSSGSPANRGCRCNRRGDAVVGGLRAPTPASPRRGSAPACRPPGDPGRRDRSPSLASHIGPEHAVVGSHLPRRWPDTSMLGIPWHLIGPDGVQRGDDRAMATRIGHLSSSDRAAAVATRTENHQQPDRRHHRTGRRSSRSKSSAGRSGGPPAR